MEVESLAFDPKKWFDQPNVENLLDFLALPQEIHAVRGMMDDVLKKRVPRNEQHHPWQAHDHSKQVVVLIFLVQRGII